MPQSTEDTTTTNPPRQNPWSYLLDCRRASVHHGRILEELIKKLPRGDDRDTLHNLREGMRISEDKLVTFMERAYLLQKELDAKSRN